MSNRRSAAPYAAAQAMRKLLVANRGEIALRIPKPIATPLTSFTPTKRFYLDRRARR